MANRTSIEWTEATWNPVRGCKVVSPGCTNCYAMRQAHRHAGPGGAYEGLTHMTKGGPVWTGHASIRRELLDWPIRLRKPSLIFVNSMSDLFHEDVPDWFISEVFSVMESVGGGRHIYQILTKRAERMMKFLRSRWLGRDVPVAMRKNIWIGVSVEDQKRADERIPLLVRTPAAVRWISAEPLLGPVDISPWLRRVTASDPSNLLAHERLDWVVVGGESGPGARPFDITWARSLRDQCASAGVPYFLKQLGHRPYSGDPATSGQYLLRDRKGGDPAEWPEDLRVREYPA